jgi:hypothetical protein
MLRHGLEARHRVLLLLGLLVAPARSTPAAGEDATPAFSAESLLEHARRLADGALEGREAGTEGERLAAEYIAAELEEAGIGPPAGWERFQRFSIPGAGEPRESRNVLGWIEGGDAALAGTFIVLGGHMDHLGKRGGAVHPGADDNASGVAVILDVAARLRKERTSLGRSVLVAFFGAEEKGLRGSRHMVASGVIDKARTALMINIDMIGRPLADQQALAPLKKLFAVDGENGIGVLGARLHPFLAETIERAAARSRLQAFGTKSIPVLSAMIDGMARNRSDDAPFERAGIPALFFGSGESDDYHRPSDTLEKIRPELMARRAAMVLEVVTALSRAPREKLPPLRDLLPPAGTERVETLRIARGDLEVVLRDNAGSPGVLSGLDSLVNVRDAPGFDAFDPDSRGASAGLNFEHIISGHRNPSNMFAPRRGRFDLHRLPDGASGILVRRREDCPWDVSSTLRYTVVEPHAIDLEFRAVLRSKALFGSRGHAIFFFASYMNDVAAVPIEFLGVERPGDEETWITADAPKGHPDWNRGGTYRHVDAAPIDVDEDHGAKLNSWSYDQPRYTRPFYFGRTVRDMVYLILFDRAHGAVDEVRFSLFTFKLPGKQRPAWDFQYVVRGVEEDREYGFRARVIWKRWVSREDCLAEYERWKEGLPGGRQ